MIHVKGMTQPQGHSTSGSHERYKSEERLQWERDHDCILKFGEWMIAEGVVKQEDLDALIKEAKKEAREGKKAAWSIYQSQPKRLRNEVLPLLKDLQVQGEKGIFTTNVIKDLEAVEDIEVAHSFKAVRKAIRLVVGDNKVNTTHLKAWLAKENKEQTKRYSSHLYSENDTDKLLDLSLIHI